MRAREQSAFGEGRPWRIGRPSWGALASLVALLAAAPLWPAAFDGGAKVEIADATGGLSWMPANSALTVMCWFKIVVPSNKSITEDMTILVSRRDGDENSTVSYLLKYNVSTGNVEFMSRRAGEIPYTKILIAQPYLARWYHVAIVRSSAGFTAYVDGQTAGLETSDPGDTSSTSGVSIGAWGSSKHFYGEIQEVAILQYALPGGTIRDMMFRDIPTGLAPFLTTLKGYYKLAYTGNEADRYRNFSADPPAGTDPGAASGSIVVEATDREGEQSIFDSRKNRGEDAIVPLTGAFTWDQRLLFRPTPGVPFDLRLLYSSALANAGPEPNGVDPYDARVLGPGWRHNFETRIIPEQTTTQRRLLIWNGDIETWVKTNNVYETRHKEYRGDLTNLADGSMEWIAPDRTAYRFYDPTENLSEGLRGRLYAITDPNGNAMQITWDEFSGRVSQITDPAGGVYSFNYSAQNLLTNVAFGQWSINFEYDGSNRLSGKWLAGPPEYASVNTRWTFAYSNNVLGAVIDPRGATNILVSYDRFGRVSQERDALGRTKRTEYNLPALRQITHTDPAGQKWIETYDRKGHLTARTDPLGDRTTIAYDAAGNPIRISRPLGNTTAYGYDARSNKTAETNDLGMVTSWTYHPWFNKPLTETNPDGWTQHWDYDDAGNLTHHYDGIGMLAQYTYFPNGLVQTSKDGNLNTTTFTYSDDGFLRTRSDPLVNTWTYTHNDIGWPLSVENPLQEIVTVSYDINGNVVRTVDALSRTRQSTYDANGNLSSRSDPKGQLTRFDYDAANQRTQTVDRAGAPTVFTYDIRGQIETIMDARGNVTSNSYDIAGRLIKVTDPLGGFATHEYDANGNRVATIDKMGKRSRRIHDRLDRVVSLVDPLGNTVGYAYDAVGRMKTITSPNGHPQSHEYDGRGRLIRWTDAEGQPWDYTYDGNGNILKITDALDGEYVMTYGKRNERLTELNQYGKLWVYTYDALGRPKTVLDPNGVTRTVAYDSGGRPETVSFTTGRIHSFIWDENDNPEVASRLGSGPTTNTRLRFDAMDRVIECRDHFNKVLTFTYDPMGHRQSLRYPDGKTLSYAYDKLGRVTAMTNWASAVMTFTYDKEDRLTSRTYPNGVVQTNAYDDAGHLISLAHRPPTGDPLISQGYAYDRNGNKVGSLERGTLAWGNPSRIDQRTRYAPAGRLIDRIDGADPARNYTYHHDANGNMTNAVGVGESLALAYDEDNRVSSLRWNHPLGSKAIINRLDVFGRRVTRTADAEETRYVLDLSTSMERVLCDTDALGNITAWYTHGPGGLLSKHDASGNVTCYHCDAQGNVITLTDESRASTAKYAYTPYGRLMPGATNDANPYRFVGASGVMEEAPNVYFMRARYYSAEAGMFLSTDPAKRVGPAGKTAFYRYARSNPMTWSDPRGLWDRREASFLAGLKPLTPNTDDAFQLTKNTPQSPDQGSKGSMPGLGDAISAAAKQAADAAQAPSAPGRSIGNGRSEDQVGSKTLDDPNAKKDKDLESDTGGKDASPDENRPKKGKGGGNFNNRKHVPDALRGEGALAYDDNPLDMLVETITGLPDMRQTLNRVMDEHLDSLVIEGNDTEFILNYMDGMGAAEGAMSREEKMNLIQERARRLGKSLR